MLKRDPDASLKTPDLVMQWLDSKDPDEYVGDGVEANSCPIANFVTEEVCGRFSSASAGTDRIHIYHILTHKEYRLPLWAERFIGKLDMRFGMQKIKAKDAKKVLEETIKDHKTALGEEVV